MNTKENSTSKLEISEENITVLLSEANISPIHLFSQKDITNFLHSIETNRDIDINLKTRKLVLADPVITGENNLKKISSACEKSHIPIILVLEVESLPELNTDIKISDYNVLPIKDDELLIRSIRSVNNFHEVIDDGTITHGELSINPANYEVFIKGQRATLRFKEYELLLLLASNPGRVFDRGTLLNQIWGYDYFGGTRTVDVHIRRLRSKIETSPDNPYIETIWNVGYRFRPIE